MALTSRFFDSIKKRKECEEIKGGVVLALFIGFIIGITAAVSTSDIMLIFIGISVMTVIIFLFAIMISNSLKMGSAFTFYFATVALACSVLIHLIIPNIQSSNASIIFPYWIFFLIVFVLSEILFLFDKRKFDKKKNTLSSRMWFTFKLKLESLFESLLIFSSVVAIVYIIMNVEWEKYYQPFIDWMKEVLIFLGTAAFIIGLFLLWLWLNSMRYNKKERNTKRKKR